MILRVTWPFPYSIINISFILIWISLCAWFIIDPITICWWLWWFLIIRYMNIWEFLFLLVFEINCIFFKFYFACYLLSFFINKWRIQDYLRLLIWKMLDNYWSYIKHRTSFSIHLDYRHHRLFMENNSVVKVFFSVWMFQGLFLCMHRVDLKGWNCSLAKEEAILKESIVVW